MKKAYSKPQILFESFEISQSIAGSCEEIVNAMPGSCGLVLFPGKTLFTSEMVGICNTTPSPGQFDDLCYDVPSDNNNVFSS